MSQVNEVCGTTAGGSGPDSAFSSIELPALPESSSLSGSTGLCAGAGLFGVIYFLKMIKN